MADLDGFVNTLGGTHTWDLYNPATGEVLASYSGLTQGQAIDRRDAMRATQGNNIEMRVTGSASQQIAQTGAIGAEWVRSLPQRTAEYLNNYRDQIRGGEHNDTLRSEHERDVVIIAIDDELRHRIAGEHAPLPANAIPDNWRGWVRSLPNLELNTITDMRSTIVSGAMNVGLDTAANKTAVLNAIDTELRSRQDAGQGAGTRTYTIYDGTGRIVNTIRSTSVARALDDFGENNDIDTTHYTARELGVTYNNYGDAQAAADTQNAAQRPGPGQSTYSVEHIPTGQVTQVIGNDAADAIQRQATATGGLHSNFRIASTGSPANNLKRYRVGNHTYGREIIHAANREEAIRLFAFNNNISVDDVTSGPSFVADLVDDEQSQDAAAQLATQVAESLKRMRKLAGLK